MKRLFTVIVARAFEQEGHWQGMRGITRSAHRQARRDVDALQAVQVRACQVQLRRARLAGLRIAPGRRWSAGTLVTVRGSAATCCCLPACRASVTEADLKSLFTNITRPCKHQRVLSIYLLYENMGLQRFSCLSFDWQCTGAPVASHSSQAPCRARTKRRSRRACRVPPAPLPEEPAAAA